MGYMGELIERRVGAKRFGLEIAYCYDAPGLDGTLGAIRRARALLGERFMVLYGDTYLRIDYAATAPYALMMVLFSLPLTWLLYVQSKRAASR